MSGFLQLLCDSPPLSFSEIKPGCLFFVLHDIFPKIMFSRAIVSSLLLAALANGLVFKRE